ncbi:MAG: alpha-E domain-containing protein [Cytophagaceae bacterium]|nr:alpha-E domain-containing protein [Cytophagaceae bacterium]MDW8456990.1 alpha-E domain-containing protein [Cytophagaceae bacterium]
MLSRIANSLFWMSRYLERTEHISRYIKVHFYSALDAPSVAGYEFIENSILNMTGLESEYKKKIHKKNIKNVNYYVLLDETNPVSIRNSVNRARENARGARDSISAEIWSSMNKFYHDVNRLSADDLSNDKIYPLTEKILENCAVVKGYIESTLLHNEIWLIMKMGMHTERTIQVIRIIKAKLADIEFTRKQKLGKPVENYQCINMLKSAEAFDMSRIYYRAVPTLSEALEFLFFNKQFPKSLVYNMRHLHNSISRITASKNPVPGSAEFDAGKLYSQLNYATIQDVEDNLDLFLDNLTEKIYSIATKTEQQFMSY